MTIAIEYEAAEELNLPYRHITESVIAETLDYEGCPYEVEINVLFTNDDGIQEINRDFRKNDRATDVLSFPLVDYERPSVFEHVEERAEDYFNPETGELMLGDIVVSVDKIKEQAKEYGHSETRELAFLITHSMLHLLGYDHMGEDERIEMEEKQRLILSRRGYER